MGPSAEGGSLILDRSMENRRETQCWRQRDELVGVEGIVFYCSCVLSGKAKSDLELSVQVGEAVLEVQGGNSIELSSRRVRE